MQGGEYKGKTVWEQAKEMGFQTVENDPAAMNALQYKDGQPVLALMSDGNMPTKFNPSKATAKDPAKDANPTVCTPTPTGSAIRLLAQGHDQEGARFAE